MAASNHESIIAGALATGLVTVLTIPSILSLGRRIGLIKQKYESSEGELYKDEDGQASEDTQGQFSTWIARSVVLVAASSGLMLQIANGVYMVTEGHLTCGDLTEACLRVSTWVISFQKVKQ